MSDCCHQRKFHYYFAAAGSGHHLYAIREQLNKISYIYICKCVCRVCKRMHACVPNVYVVSHTAFDV